MGKYNAARDLDLSIHIRWYVVCNRVEAVIYRDNDDRKSFVFVERLSNPKGKRTETELVSDKPGSVYSSGGNGTIHHGLDKTLSHHERSAKLFANRIAAKLAGEQKKGRYTELVIAAEPHFLGLIRKALPATVRKLVTFEINREYAQGSDKALRKQILHAIETRVA